MAEHIAQQILKQGYQGKRKVTVSIDRSEKLRTIRAYII